VVRKGEGPPAAANPIECTVRLRWVWRFGRSVNDDSFPAARKVCGWIREVRPQLVIPRRRRLSLRSMRRRSCSCATAWFCRLRVPIIRFRALRLLSGQESRHLYYMIRSRNLIAVGRHAGRIFFVNSGATFATIVRDARMSRSQRRLVGVSSRFTYNSPLTRGHRKRLSHNN